MSFILFKATAISLGLSWLLFTPGGIQRRSCIFRIYRTSAIQVLSRCLSSANCGAPSSSRLQVSGKQAPEPPFSIFPSSIGSMTTMKHGFTTLMDPSWDSSNGPHVRRPWVLKVRAMNRISSPKTSERKEPIRRATPRDGRRSSNQKLSPKKAQAQTRYSMLYGIRGNWVTRPKMRPNSSVAITKTGIPSHRGVMEMALGSDDSRLRARSTPSVARSKINQTKTMGAKEKKRKRSNTTSQTEEIDFRSKQF